jgi:hypothetical protein
MTNLTATPAGDGSRGQPSATVRNGPFPACKARENATERITKIARGPLFPRLVSFELYIEMNLVPTLRRELNHLVNDTPDSSSILFHPQLDQFWDYDIHLKSVEYGNPKWINVCQIWVPDGI